MAGGAAPRAGWTTFVIRQSDRIFDYSYRSLRSFRHLFTNGSARMNVGWGWATSLRHAMGTSDNTTARCHGPKPAVAILPVICSRRACSSTSCTSCPLCKTCSQTLGITIASASSRATWAVCLARRLAVAHASAPGRGAFVLGQASPALFSVKFDPRIILQLTSYTCMQSLSTFMIPMWLE
eukprot:COSAG02_NODE_11990_length_1618_cov_7.698486_1_plen_181_part_00